MSGAALVIAHLFVGVATDAQYPAIAQAPAKCVVGMELAAGLVVGVLVFEVVIVHQARIGIETRGVHVGHGIYRLYGVVVSAEVDQVVLVILAAGRHYEVDTHGGVELVAVVEPDHRTQVSVAQAALVFVRAVLDVQPYVIER